MPRALLCLLLPLAATAVAQPFALPPGEPDLRNGQDINGVCAGCHLDFGQGGKAGEYPRIAGLPIGYLYSQVKLFQKNTRPNLPMLEHVHERQLSDQEILDISAYLSRIQLPMRQAPMEESDPKFNAYERLMESKRVVQIPVYQGNTENGRKIYDKDCKSCHGRDGWGNAEKNVPQLAGQYTEYLLRQIAKFNRKVRVHDWDDPNDEMLKEYSEEEIGDILAYLSIVDD
jgi:cytochrome c553